MDRQEAIRMANRIAEATPNMTWFVLYWQVSDCYQLIPQTELEADVELTEARIVHVAHRAAELQLA